MKHEASRQQTDDRREVVAIAHMAFHVTSIVRLIDVTLVYHENEFKVRRQISEREIDAQKMEIALYINSSVQTIIKYSFLILNIVWCLFVQ
jgi:hypothetical protein